MIVEYKIIRMNNALYCAFIDKEKGFSERTNAGIRKVQKNSYGLFITVNNGNFYLKRNGDNGDKD